MGDHHGGATPAESVYQEKPRIRPLFPSWRDRAGSGQRRSSAAAQTAADYAGIKEDIILLAYSNRIECWDQALYDQLLAAEPEDFARLAEEIMGTVESLRRSDEPSVDLHIPLPCLGSGIRQPAWADKLPTLTG